MEQLYENQAIEDTQQYDVTHNSVIQKEPGNGILNKPYSLQADIITGWQPKLKVLGPIPFNFDNRVVDDIVDQLTSFGSKYDYRVIYLGFRHQSSFKMQQHMKKDYYYKHQGLVNSNFSHMAAYFRKFHANFRAKFSRLFRGMNPTLRPNEQIFFDSNFQSGNLDAVVRVKDKQNQYDLFMRVDTNTRGHVQWFNFKIKNAGYKKIKINICNFRRHKTLYARGMKPYVYSEHLCQKTGVSGWHQGGEKVRYEKRKLRYNFLDEFYYPDALNFNFLCFEYTFIDDFEDVQFAYCPPFTYSDNIAMIKQLKLQASQMLKCQDSKQENQMKNEQKNQPIQIIKEQNLCQSLGGLDLPILTITDFQVPDNKKKCILVSGRIHPGETCGSFMIKGFLKFICSNSTQAKELRKKVVFKVIPMLNPDGVVAGNFRTSLNGKDLNRAFRNSLDMLIPQVKALKQLVFQLKTTFQNRLIFFIDFHGHSVKKNVFLYGPEYQIWQPNYYRTRVFPRILSSKTQMFRYYSCLFRVATFKRSTARAVILRNVPHCYTIQASTGFYYSNEERKDIPFTPQDWQNMGFLVAEGVNQYVDIFYSESLKGMDRTRRINDLKNLKSQTKKPQKKGNQKFQMRIVTTSKNKKLEKKDDKNQREEICIPLLPEKAQRIIDQIKKQQEQRKNNNEQDGHQSDEYSEGGSDSQGSEDDIPEQQLQALHGQILVSMKQFREKLYNTKQKDDPFREAQNKKKQLALDAKRMNSNRQSKKIEVIPSLRKKMQSMNKQKQIIKQSCTSYRPKGTSFDTKALNLKNDVIVIGNKNSNIELGRNLKVSIRYEARKSYQPRNKMRITQDIFRFCEQLDQLEEHSNYVSTHCNYKEEIQFTFNS